MPEQAYYFINHTCREFTFFTKHISIYKALIEAIKYNKGWSKYDDIRVDSEAFDSTSCLEYLDSKRYKLAKLTPF